MIDLAILGQDPAFGGGVSTMTNELLRAAVSLGRSPELLYLRYRSLDGRRLPPTLPEHPVRPLVPGLDGVNVLAAAFGNARRAREARSRFVCAAVASHGYAARLADRPYGCWVTTSLEDEWASRRAALPASRRAALAASAPLLRRLERATLRGAAVLWATSAAARDLVADAAGLSPADVRHVPVPVDSGLLTPLEDDAWERALAEPELLFIGRADDGRKNLPLLLDAFALLRERLPEVRLTLVGEPPRRALPAGVRALGHVGSVTVPLRAAALLVLPSLQEGFGIVVAEALACGVPVLVTPCGGPEELVRTSGGGVVLSTFQPEELAARAEAMLADRPALREMRRRGRAHVVDAHDPHRLQAALAEAFETLAA